MCAHASGQRARIPNASARWSCCAARNGHPPERRSRRPDGPGLHGKSPMLRLRREDVPPRMAQFPLRDGESEPYTPRVSGANPKNFAAITRAARDGIPGAVRPMPPQANGVMNCPQPSPRAHMRCVEQRPAWAPAFLPAHPALPLIRMRQTYSPTLARLHLKSALGKTIAEPSRGIGAQAHVGGPSPKPQTCFLHLTAHAERPVGYGNPDADV